MTNGEFDVGSSGEHGSGDGARPLARSRVDGTEAVDRKPVRDARITHNENLFVELLGGFGDVLTALAAVQALARSHPEARLTVLTFLPRRRAARVRPAGKRGGAGYQARSRPSAPSPGGGKGTTGARVLGSRGLGHVLRWHRRPDR